MKYFLVCFLVIMSCKSAKDVGNSNVIIGIALNEKYGAIVHANNEIYAIAGLQSWDSTYLSKKVKVKGRFELLMGKDKVEIGNFGTFQAQSYSRYYIVEDATWELYNFN